MKKIILTIFISTLILRLSAQTTQEEYNYITKGYKVQIESGLDMKKGYQFQDVDNVKSTAPNGTIAREAWLKALYRVPTNAEKSIAAYMIIYQLRDKVNEREYLCIPNPFSSQEIRDAYFKSLYDGTAFASERLQLIAFLISRSLKF